MLYLNNRNTPKHSRHFQGAQTHSDELNPGVYNIHVLWSACSECGVRLWAGEGFLCRTASPPVWPSIALRKGWHPLVFIHQHPLNPVPVLLLALAKLGLLCGRALRHADLSRMWPHKRAQSECNELSAHYTDMSTFDMSSGSQRWTLGQRRGGLGWGEGTMSKISFGFFKNKNQVLSAGSKGEKHQVRI